ncbi:DMT family transporter [Aquamicrobium lusatiense]|uniref:DMT family transporter n=1 Tax=Aquamicrobium lusatiense TaxID=89772 RepID=UPI00245758F7|nr:DMT family transporter [Aquamicrobium lusatiense]MDH4992097.1 DMT family transporter [Aquamicrobium lusatiense]
MSQLATRNVGICSILVAVLLLAMSDALVKGAGERLALAQLVLLRSTFAMVFIVAFVSAFSGRVRRISFVASRWVWMRSLCLAGMWISYYAALPFMSLSLAAACYYTAPVWMALLSRALFAEAIGWARGVAVAIAFLGVLVAVNPWGSELSPAALLAIAAAFLYAIAALVTGRRCQNEDPVSLALNLNLVLVVCGAIGVSTLLVSAPTNADSFVFSAWPKLRPADWALILVLALMHPLIEVAVAKAYQLAPATTIGVFDNAYLPFAAFWSFLLLSQTPTWSEAMGMLLIGAAAILIVRCR